MNSDPRHRVRFRQLWIDNVRDQLDKAGTSHQLDFAIKTNALALLTRTSFERIRSLSPQEFAIELMNHDLADPLPIVTMRALKAKGYPKHELTAAKNWPSCQVKVTATLNWSSANVLRNPETQIMLLDDRTATAVAHSKNVCITAAELQLLPHNPCLIEFYRPIQIAETVKRGVRVRAVGNRNKNSLLAKRSRLTRKLSTGSPRTSQQSIRGRSTLWPMMVHATVISCGVARNAAMCDF